MGRQFSDNGHESGIGSDSDSGNSAVFFETTDTSLSQTTGHTISDETRVIYYYSNNSSLEHGPAPQHMGDVQRPDNQHVKDVQGLSHHLIRDVWGPPPQHARDVHYNSHDRYLVNYADLATPLGVVHPDGYTAHPTTDSPIKLNPHSHSSSSQVTYHDSMVSLKNNRESRSKSESYNSNRTYSSTKLVSPTLGIFRDARRQLSFEHSASTNQPVSRPSLIKRSVSSDSRTNKIQNSPSADIQRHQLIHTGHDYVAQMHPELLTRSPQEKNHLNYRQSSVVDNDWLRQKNLAKRLQQAALSSHSAGSSPMSEPLTKTQKQTYANEYIRAGTVSCSEQDVSNTPEQLRRQCESLQLRLSQDFSPAPIVRHSIQIGQEKNDITNEHSTVAAAIAAKKRFNQNKYTNICSSSLEAAVYNQKEINNNDVAFRHPGNEVHHPLVVGLDNVCQTPTRQFSGSGFVRKVAFEDDQPATLPRAAQRAPVMKGVASPANSPKIESSREVFNWRNGIAEAKRRWGLIGRQQKTREAVKAVGPFSTAVDVPPDLSGGNQQLGSQSTDLDR